MIKSFDEDKKGEAGQKRNRMEIHMEESPDGKAKIVIMMEGVAQKLAVSAVAMAATSFFAY